VIIAGLGCDLRNNHFLTSTIESRQDARQGLTMSKQSEAMRHEQLARNDEMWGRIGVGFIAAAAVIELVRGAVGFLL
jgi:hypothetical protein